MANWAVAEAKAKFSAVLDKAKAEGPQLVQRRKERFFVLTEEQLQAERAGSAPKSGKSAWDALRPSSGEFFDVNFPRLRSKPRVVKL
jgi:hypothetical protein